MEVRVDTLFSPVSIGPVPLHHRVVTAPLTRSRSKQPGDVPGWAFRFCRTKFARFGIRASPEFDLSIMMRQKQASVKALGRLEDRLKLHPENVAALFEWIAQRFAELLSRKETNVTSQKS
jgi:hypothetical protein